MKALVLVFHDGSAAEETSLQALTFARKLAGGAAEAVVIGPGAAQVAPSLGGTVHVAEHAGLSSFAPDAWARILVDLADAIGADAFLTTGTETGNDVLARVAARIDEPFAANCTIASAGSDGTVTLTRSRWGGSLFEEARLRPAKWAVLSVAPHAVAAEAAGGSATIKPFAPTLDDADLLVRVKEQVGKSAGGVSLADAKVVISGGRGTGSTEGFSEIEELAGLLKAAVGCSRAVTIAGWRPHTDQVGQTGTKIAPDLYIACGISGATQHMAGCKAAKKVLAINMDPEAPIMTNADYAVVGNLHEVVPAITAEIKRVKG